MNNPRIYLSPPNVSSAEKEMLLKVMDEGWIAPMGSSIDQFEENISLLYDNRRVLGLNSGTSALHLSLILSGVVEGDDVLVGTFTFAACVNVVLYQKANPIFIDSEYDTWNLDPEILSNYLKTTKKKPKAAVITHLYGVPAQIDSIKKICSEHNVILIEDAAEAVGSTWENKPLGVFGDFGILSFNGNKIVTTGGGGALLTNKEGYDRGIYLATQANSGKSDFYHESVGYNYRMSNVLAGIGVAQLEKLDQFVSKKRKIFDCYKEHLTTWFIFPSEQKAAYCNRWLSTPLAKERIDISGLIEFLEKSNIESRRLWRPLHMHPAYLHYDFMGSGIAEEIYDTGICLPSGTGMSDDQQNLIIEKILDFMDKK